MDKKIVEIANQGITLPHDVVSLPSKGVFYPGKQKSLKVGYLTASDENILLSDTQGNNQDIIYNLLTNKIYEPGFDTSMLLYGDVQAILIFLRNTAFGSVYTLKNLVDPLPKNPESRTFDADVDLSELNFKEIVDSPDENGEYTMTLPVSKKIVKLRPLRIKDYMEVDARMSMLPKGRIKPRQTALLSKYIVSIDGNSDRGYVEMESEKLPIKDSKEIRKFMIMNEPGVDLRRKVTAPSGMEVDVNIDFGAEFFRPFFEL